MRVRLPFVMALTASLHPTILSAGTCPESCIERFTAPAWQPTFCTSEPFLNCPNPGYDCIEWNLQTGEWQLQLGAGFSENAQRIVLRDDFILTGPAAAIPLPITLRVHLVGELDSCGAHSGVSGDVRLSAGTIAQQWHFVDDWTCQPFVVDETLELAFTQLPNQPFRIETVVSGGVFAAGLLLHGTTEFVLPDGYAIQSCQGFQSTPIGVEASTWSQVKHLFE